MENTEERDGKQEAIVIVVDNMGREKAIIIDLKEFTNWLENNEDEWPKTISRHNLSNY